MSVANPIPARPSQLRGEQTRRQLLDAALVEFAAVGFDAASTRAIAARAGVKQGQLTYHFPTKDELWQATVDCLFARFDEESASLAASFPPPSDEATAIEVAVRVLVRVVSRLPELNRVMIHASTADSDRLAWLVERHVRPRFDELSRLWERVRAARATHLDADPLLIYYCVIGAASLLYVNAPEAARLSSRADGTDVVSGALVESHADAIIAMLLGPRSTRGRTRTSTKGR